MNTAVTSEYNIQYIICYKNNHSLNIINCFLFLLTIINIISSYDKKEAKKMLKKIKFPDFNKKSLFGKDEDVGVFGVCFFSSLLIVHWCIIHLFYFSIII